MNLNFFPILAIYALIALQNISILSAESSSDEQGSALEYLAQKRAVATVQSEGTQTVKGNRFYKKNMSFSVAIPEYLRGGIINEVDDTQVLFGKDEDGMVVVTIIPTTCKVVSTRECIEIAKETFYSFELSKLEKACPGSKIRYESQWIEKPHSGYFAVVEVPGGITFLDNNGLTQIDSLRGYLVSFVDGIVVIIVVEEKMISRKCGEDFLPIDFVRIRLLDEAVKVLKSFRSHSTATL